MDFDPVVGPPKTYVTNLTSNSDQNRYCGQHEYQYIGTPTPLMAFYSKTNRAGDVVFLGQGCATSATLQPVASRTSTPWVRLQAGYIRTATVIEKELTIPPIRRIWLAFHMMPIETLLTQLELHG